MLDGDGIGDLNKRGHSDLMEMIWVRKSLGPNIISFPKRNNSPSFTVVRHPIYRLVSAWLEKLGPVEPGHSERDKTFQFVIISTFLQNFPIWL